jgi:hypothetical protein
MSVVVEVCRFSAGVYVVRYNRTVFCTKSLGAGLQRLVDVFEAKSKVYLVPKESDVSLLVEGYQLGAEEDLALVKEWEGITDG